MKCEIMEDFLWSKAYGLNSNKRPSKIPVGKLQRSLLKAFFINVIKSSFALESFKLTVNDGFGSVIPGQFEGSTEGLNLKSASNFCQTSL